jgi:hypothetical protein
MKIDTENGNGCKPGKDRRIELDVSRHCIQTAARRRYEKILSDCLRSQVPDDDLEKQLDLLRQALETLDFGLLRSRWPELAGGHRVNVGLSRAEGRIVVHIDTRSFPAPLGNAKTATGSKR